MNYKRIIDNYNYQKKIIRFKYISASKLHNEIITYGDCSEYDDCDSEITIKSTNMNKCYKCKLYTLYDICPVCKEDLLASSKVITNYINESKFNTAYSEKTILYIYENEISEYIASF